jgi:hypothetical protein
MTHAAVVADPLRDPLPAAWDRLVTDAGLSPLWGSGVLRSLAWYERYRPVVALVQDASGEPCAAFCSRHVRVPPGRRAFHDPAGRPLAGFLEMHLPPVVTTAGYAFHPHLDVAARPAVVKAAERALAAHVGLSCGGFAYRQVAAADLPTFRRGARIVLAASPDAVVENRWGDMDEYLADLPGADRRELRRIRRIVDGDANLRVAVEESLPASEAARLAHVVRTRYRSRRQTPMPLPAALYDWLAALDGARHITYRDPSGRLLAFGTLVDDGTEVRSLLWGLRDRSEGGRTNLYFDHLLRELEYCIAHGRRRLVMGKTMVELKRRFGARPVRLYTVARVRRRAA